MWPIRRRKPYAPEPGSEADVQRILSDAGYIAACKSYAEWAVLAEASKKLRARNHFAESIRRAMIPRTEGLE